MSRPKEGFHSMNVYIPEDKVQPLKVYAAQHSIPGGASELICRLALERWEQLQGGRVEVRAPSSAPTPEPVRQVEAGAKAVPASSGGKFAEKACERCGKRFTPKNGAAAAKARFCSPTCKGNWWKKEKASSSVKAGGKGKRR